VYSNLALFLDLSEGMPIGQMEKSVPNAQMEKNVPKAQMEKKLDYQPLAFDISTTGKNSF
jgi:hypothetical protein